MHLFEKICLEGFQSGLSWLTILRKRENFRAAFAGFDFRKVAVFDESDVDRLLQDAGIVRHRGKIESTINNARRAIDLVEECGSLAVFVWSFEPSPEERPSALIGTPCAHLVRHHPRPRSPRRSKRGWSFVGPTTMYASMQSEGIVNDHIEEPHCPRGV